MIAPNLKERLQSTLDRTYIQMKWKKFKKGSFYRKVPLYFEHSHYIVKTVESLDELQQVLRLRYQVFIAEGLNKKRNVKLDFESYDFAADHLVVIDKATKQIVGTYRLICSMFSEHFYSQSEFQLDKLLELPGGKLELGRACIHQDFRNGSVIALLWRGLLQYMDLTNSRYLFGCASVKTQDPELTSKLYSYLKAKGSLKDEHQVVARPEFQMPGFRKDFEFAEEDEAELRKQVPTLLRSYIKAGAGLEGEPAYDRAMKCVDFLTLLDIRVLDKDFDSRFRS